MRPLSTIRGRLLVLIGLALLPLVGFMGLARARLIDHAQEEWGDDALRLAETAATTHVETLRRTRWVLKALADVPAARSPEQGTCQAIFGEFFESEPYYTAFGIAEPDGRTVCTIPATDSMYLGDRAYFSEAVETGRPTLSDYHIGHITGRSVVTMAVPALAADSGVVTVLAAGIDLGGLDPLPPNAPLPAGAHLTLVDREGRVLYHTPDSVPTGSSIDPAVQDLVEAVADDTVATLDVPGVGRRAYAVAPVEDRDGTLVAHVVVSFDPVAVAAQIEALARSSYLGVGAAALLLVLGLWVAVELLVLRRVKALVATADRLGRGELDARVGAGGGEDEIARLGRAFDRMAENLEAARTAEVEWARQRVAESEQRLELLAETIDEVFWIWDPVQQRYEYLSPAFDVIWGFSRARLYADAGVWLASMHPDDREGLAERMIDGGTLREGEHEYRIVRPDGEERWIASRTFAVHDDGGEVVRYLGVAQDVTDQKTLEDALLHATKLEAVGRLAGGVAHDFNNILTAIQGHARFLEETIPEDHPAREDLEEITTGVTRATGLTRQLLTFSRKQPVRTEVLDMNDVLRGTATMLARLIGEDVELELDLDPAAPSVEGDVHQMEQIILNLAVNARDAMPAGGTLTLRTRREVVESTEALGADVVHPGEYALLEVRDTGRGMDPATIEHIFEPFFTTKPPGEGTGLGLATVYGIVKQSGGALEVSSVEDEGTTFCVYLPAAATAARSTPAPRRDPREPTAGHAVLLVEDEDAVRSVMTRMLERMGITVTAASSGSEALELVRRGAAPDVVVTDVVMPGMNGVELYERLTAVRPDLPVVFMSGYPGYGTDDGPLTGDHPFLQKPFTVEDLTAAIQDALERD